MPKTGGYFGLCSTCKKAWNPQLSSQQASCFANFGVKYDNPQELEHLVNWLKNIIKLQCIWKDRISVDSPWTRIMKATMLMSLCRVMLPKIYTVNKMGHLQEKNSGYD